MTAQEVVKKGMKWRVGNGESILLWSDKWLPSPASQKVLSPTNHILPNDAKVSALIDLEKKEWNEQLVRQALGAEEADLVLGIPLSMHLPPDRCIWDVNRKGKFTVRSAHKSLMEGLDNGSEGESSDGTVMKQIWRSIWGMKTPNKIRSFAWKAFRGILPTKENLKRRHVIVDDLCETCGKEPENYSHLFWFCDKVAKVWSNCKLVFPFQIEKRWNFIDVIWQIIRQKPTNSTLLEKTVTVCWEIWKNRNALRHGGTRKPGRAIVHSAMALVEEYRSANEVVSPINPSEAIKWHPPESPKYKLNIAGAVFIGLKASGMGMLVRDSEGRVMAAMSRRFPAPLAALEAEAKTMEAAAIFAWEMGFREVTFETDSLLLYRSLLGTSEPPSSIETIISSILSLVQFFQFLSCKKARQ